MNILTLSIKQKYFDEILAGTKKQEFREVRPNTAKKYVNFMSPSPNGKIYTNYEDIPEEETWDFAPVKYDALKLCTGAYKGKRPYMIVEVESAEAYLITDDNGEAIVIGEGTEDEYALASICYNLGKVLEVELYE